MDKNKLIIIGILVAVIIVVSGTLIYVSSVLNRVANSSQNKLANGDNSKQSIPIEQIETFSISDPITANLLTNKEDDQNHIIRLSVSIGMDTKSKDYKKIKEQVDQKTVVMRSDILSLLKTKQYDEMIRPDAQEVLSQEILEVISAEFQTEAFVKVYFGEFFVQ